MDKAEKKAWREAITDLIIAIGDDVGIKEENQILMMMYLNTPRKIKRFSDWAKARTVDNHLTVTPEAVMHAVSQIERGDEVLD